MRQQRPGVDTFRRTLGCIFEQRAAQFEQLDDLVFGQLDDAHALPWRALGETVGDQALQRLADRTVREAELLAQLRFADALAGRVGAVDDTLAQRLRNPLGAREPIGA